MRLLFPPMDGMGLNGVGRLLPGIPWLTSAPLPRLRESELRIHELLDDICEKMDQFQLYTEVCAPSCATLSGSFPLDGVPGVAPPL